MYSVVESHRVGKLLYKYTLSQNGMILFYGVGFRPNNVGVENGEEPHTLEPWSGPMSECVQRLAALRRVGGPRLYSLPLFFSRAPCTPILYFIKKRTFTKIVKNNNLRIKKSKRGRVLFLAVKRGRRGMVKLKEGGQPPIPISCAQRQAAIARAAPIGWGPCYVPSGWFYSLVPRSTGG
jgi:hypothetical protein